RTALRSDAGRFAVSCSSASALSRGRRPTARSGSACDFPVPVSFSRSPAQTEGNRQTDRRNCTRVRAPGVDSLVNVVAVDAHLFSAVGAKGSPNRYNAPPAYALRAQTSTRSGRGRQQAADRKWKSPDWATNAADTAAVAPRRIRKQTLLVRSFEGPSESPFALGRWHRAPSLRAARRDGSASRPYDHGQFALRQGLPSERNK